MHCLGHDAKMLGAKAPHHVGEETLTGAFLPAQDKADPRFLPRALYHVGKKPENPFVVGFITGADVGPHVCQE